MVVGTLTTAWSSSTVGTRVGGVVSGDGAGACGCGSGDAAGACACGSGEGLGAWAAARAQNMKLAAATRSTDAGRTNIGRGIARDVPVKVLSVIEFDRSSGFGFYRF